MPEELQTKQLRDDAARIITVWRGNPDLKVKNLTLAELEADDTALAADEAELSALRDQLTTVLNRRNDRRKTLRKKVVAGRAGIKGYFGSDSSEYERAGGTRDSERK
ncbi:hypothetical protein [Armatimonas rosea]|uniref:Uncharacterized protein n=1 Tax=Armatimonas rosea TaxID=685828 RepID=A0A7W9ST80_ARMRO|nr:hypothetical protein [Armatimonas rosea]MBB6052417.1 hypothetical protein [Armatimonas rosea]